jgi:hypothetical protein
MVQKRSLKAWDRLNVIKRRLYLDHSFYSVTGYTRLFLCVQDHLNSKANLSGIPAIENSKITETAVEKDYSTEDPIPKVFYLETGIPKVSRTGHSPKPEIRRQGETLRLPPVPPS